MATLEVGAGKAYATLQEAVGVAGNGDTIVLTEDISESTLKIDGKDITVDLGGFTFTGKTYITNGADVVIKNGKMTVAGNSPSFNDAVIKVMDGEVEVDGVKTVVPTSLELNGVEVDGGEAINSRYYTNAVTYDATGGLTITDCTITAGTATRNADCESIGSISTSAVGIYAPNKSGGKIEITNSTITGGYGKTDAEWTGYISQLFSPGGYGISLHGTSEVTITDSTVNGGGSNWYNAGYAINVSNQFSGTLDVADSAVNGGNAEGQVGNYGQGGSGIYTHTSTSCESIDITGSTITGGAGGKSTNAFGIEYRNEDIKMNITESTVAAGNGANASGGGAAIGIYNSDSTQVVLDNVKLNGEGNGSNTVIKGGDKGITVVGPVEVTGGELTNTVVNVDATGLNGSEEIISGATGDGVQVNVSGNDDAVVVVDGGKTYVTTETDPADADTSIIYVNNNWDGKEANTMVGVGKFIGINAFADVTEAMKVVENNGTIKISGSAVLTGESGVIAPWGEGSDAGVVALYELNGKTVTWTADSAATIDVNVRHVVLRGEGTLNIAENVTLKYCPADNTGSGTGESLFVIGSFWAGDDATEKVVVNLDGDIVVGDVAASGDNGSVKVRHNGELNVSKTGSIDADYSIRVRGGELNVVGNGKDAEEAQLKSQRLEINGAGIEGGKKSVVNIKDTYISITYGGGNIADSFDMQGNRDYGYAKEFNFENSKVETGILKLGDSVTVFNGTGTDFIINNTATNAGTMNLADSTLSVAKTLTNNGTITVSGESTLNINKLSGEGWIYMDGAILDADTALDGAKVRFASGASILDGTTIDNGFFQVGIGSYMGTDEKVDTVNGVTVTAQNNAHIGARDVTYGGWIGTGYYDTDAEKAAAMTDARYTLNINNSIAEFGYLHVSQDGILNVTGDAGTKAVYAGYDYSFQAGQLIVNGVATFDNVDVLAFNTNVSCDNGTATPGKLVIQNGAHYEVEHDGGGANGGSLKVSKTGEVEVLTDAVLDIKGSVDISSDASLKVDGATLTQ